jgi:hypothetical protein
MKKDIIENSRVRYNFDNRVYRFVYFRLNPYIVAKLEKRKRRNADVAFTNKGDGSSCMIDDDKGTYFRSVRNVLT